MEGSHDHQEHSTVFVAQNVLVCHCLEDGGPPDILPHECREPTCEEQDHQHCQDNGESSSSFQAQGLEEGWQAPPLAPQGEQEEVPQGVEEAQGWLEEAQDVAPPQEEEQERRRRIEGSPLSREIIWKLPFFLIVLQF